MPIIFYLKIKEFSVDKYGKKDFKRWIKIKKRIHYENIIRSIKEGEIWWCRLGENVGNEICGKGKDFLRPVLIVRKLSKTNFIGIPLTSQKHVGSWYVEFKFGEKYEYAVVAQVENISVKRLFYKMGEVPKDDLIKVIDGLFKLIIIKK